MLSALFFVLASCLATVDGRKDNAVASRLRPLVVSPDSTSRRLSNGDLSAENLGSIYDALDTIADLIEDSALVAADSYASRRDACHDIGTSSVTQFISTIAQETHTTITLDFAFSSTFIFIHSEMGVSLIWGEGGEFACANTANSGVALNLFNYGSRVAGVSFSPEFAGGWSAVANTNLQCYLLGLSDDVGLALEIKVNPDRFSETSVGQVVEDAIDSISFGNFFDFLNPFTLMLEALVGVVGTGFGIVAVGGEINLEWDILDFFKGNWNYDLEWTDCSEELVYCSGEGCDEKNVATGWSDGTWCFSNCEECDNTATWWHGPTPDRYVCGVEPCWAKDTACLTNCDVCCNGSSLYWTGWYCN